jgi:hypothetical protein
MAELQIINEEFPPVSSKVLDTNHIGFEDKIEYEIACLNKEKSRALIGIKIVYNIPSSKGENYIVNLTGIGKFNVARDSQEITVDDVYGLTARTMDYLNSIAKKILRNSGSIIGGAIINSALTSTTFPKDIVGF